VLIPLLLILNQMPGRILIRLRKRKPMSIPYHGLCVSGMSTALAPRYLIQHPYKPCRTRVCAHITLVSDLHKSVSFNIRSNLKQQSNINSQIRFEKSSQIKICNN
jgi:hypothetical protein